MPAHDGLGMSVGRKLLLVLVSACITIGLSAGSALAGTSNGQLSSFSFQPSSTEAGGSANLTLDATFSSPLTSLQLNLPPGLWASLATAPSGTQIGSGTVTAAGASSTVTLATSSIPWRTSDTCGAAGNARNPLGTCTLTAVTISALGVTNYGYITLDPSTATLQVVLPSFESNAGISQLHLTIDASTPNGQFIRLPSSNNPATSTISINNGAGTGSDSFTPTNTGYYYAHLASATANVNSKRQAQVILDIPQPAGGIGTQSVSLNFPSSVLTLGSGVTQDLCGPPNPPGSCSGNTAISAPVQVGTASLTTPLLTNPVSGTVLLSGSRNAPVATIVFPSLGGLSFSGKLATSSVGSDSFTNLDFTGVPDLPFSDLKVTLDGNDTGLFNATCSDPRYHNDGSPYYSTQLLFAGFTGWWNSESAMPTPFSPDIRVNGCPAAVSTLPSTTSTSSKTIGKPTLTKLTLTGLAKGKPRLAFRLTQGKNADELSAFSVNVPGALSYVTKNFKHDLAFHGAKVKSAKVIHGKLVVELKQRTHSAGVVLGIGSLKETKQLQTSVKRHKARSLNFRTAVRAAKTLTNLAAQVNRFS